MPKRDDDAPVTFTLAHVASDAPPAQPLPADLEAIAAAIHAARPRTKHEAPVYGRRRQGFVQLGLTVSPGVKARLRAAAETADVTMSELLDALLNRHLPR